MDPTTQQVFGVSSKPVLSYIERPSVDNRFLEAVASDKQVVVYGSSKQGKTALVSRYLPYDDNTVVSLTPRTAVTDIYASILRQAGIKIQTTESESKSRDVGVSLGMKFKAMIPVFGSAETAAKSDLKATSGSVQGYEEIPFNLELPQDVTELLKKVRPQSKVILENFHYLSDECQQQLAFDFRTFQELGVQFIILGVWREKNRLIQFNGDLLDRIIEVPVEPWTVEEFDQVAEVGAEKLNITFARDATKACSEASFSSIGVYQEILKETCLNSGILDRQEKLIEIGSIPAIEAAVSKKADDYSARHQRALEAIAAGYLSSSQKDGLMPLFLPYYLAQAILGAGYEGLASGMRRAIIQENIQKLHHRPKDVRGSDMSNLLYNLAKLQANKNISPPIIDYDKTSKMLQIVDSTFYFFLKHADLKAIAGEIPNPME